MKFQNPFFFCVALAVTLFFYKKNSGDTQIKPRASRAFTLVVERGAFQYDRFELTPDMIAYFPEENATHHDAKYMTRSEVELADQITQNFIDELENKGFWNLENRYSSSLSCLSELNITLSLDGKTKRVICDDFERDCPELLKYIEQKVIEFEGNDLKRIYLPG